jgi:hypothetical protein
VNAFTTGTPPSGAKPIGKGVATTTATTVTCDAVLEG